MATSPETTTFSIFFSPYDHLFDRLKDVSYSSSYGFRFQFYTDKTINAIVGSQISFMNMNEGLELYSDELRTALFIGPCLKFSIGQVKVNFGLSVGFYRVFFVNYPDERPLSGSNIGLGGLYLAPYFDAAWSLNRNIDVGVFTSYSTFLVLHSGISLSYSL